jgi:predicted alpha/beta-hydrolase family hydrolase
MSSLRNATPEHYSFYSRILKTQQAMSTAFTDLEGEPGVRGFLHLPSRANGDGFVLTHGAGSNCRSELLVQMADALVTSGFAVLRIDLPFRQARPHGPPFPGGAKGDRDGLQRALAVLQSRVSGRVFLGGHSYGGRQSTILVSKEPQVAEGSLLLSYPLHPPQKPAQLRTVHFSKITKPAFFVHGTRDPFGSIAEMKAALELIPGRHTIMEVDGAGHELLSKTRSGRSPTDLLSRIAEGFQAFVSSRPTA